MADKDLEFAIERFQLTPSKGGLFEFLINEQLVFSKKALGRHAEAGELALVFKKYLAEQA